MTKGRISTLYTRIDLKLKNYPENSTCHIVWGFPISITLKVFQPMKCNRYIIKKLLNNKNIYNIWV